MPGLIPPHPQPPKPKLGPPAPPVQSPVPSNPISRAIVKKVAKQLPTSPGLTIKQQQQRLKAAGFNVTVDGIEGPQTAMARKAYVNGVAPGYWNKVWVKNHPSGASSGAAPPSGGTSGGSSTSPPTTGSGSMPTHPARTPAGTTHPAPLDPTAYAQQAANAEFNPQITDANYNLDFANKQKGESLKDLTGWNKQVTNTFNANDAAAGYQPGIDQAIAAQGNVANLFGESTAPDSLAQNSPDVAMLQGLQGNQKGFQDIMQSVLAAQGRDYARRATREGNVDITKAQTSRDALIQQKGAAQSKYRFDAQNQAIQNDQSQQALDQAAALAPGAQALQAAQVKVAQTEANNAPAIAKLGLQKAKAETAATIAAAKAAADKAGGKINWNDPALIQNVANTALTGSIGPKGGLVLRPDLALQNLLTVAQGHGAPPSVVKAGIAKLLASLNISHGKKQWSRWTFNGREFVLAPKPKK